MILGATHGSFSQNIPIGAWQDHLPYNDAISVAEANNTIYCATSSAIFTYDQVDFSIQRINLVNGLSDIGISKIKFNTATNRLIVAYANGNLDIIDENKNIINIAAIKTSNVIGDKSINDIYIKNKLAYLSCGFGIVVLDVERLEIKDTYLIGPSGTYVQVNAITMDTLNIYAATQEGVYTASLSAPNLADNNEWSTLGNLKDSAYSNIAYANKQLFLVQKRTPAVDSIFVGSNGTWQPFPEPAGVTNNLCLLRDGAIAVLWNWGAAFYDNTLNKYGEIFNYSPMDIIRANDYSYWMADVKQGLIHFNDPWDTSKEAIRPNSPSSADVFDLELIDGELWTASGGLGILNSGDLLNHRASDGSWDEFDANFLSGITDIVKVKIDPTNSNRVYASSWQSGLFEIVNGQVVNNYIAQNSVLDSVFFGITTVGTIDFDSDNNLWVTCSYTNGILAAKTPSNDWYSFSFPGITNPAEFYLDFLIDNNNYKWIGTQEEHKIYVFDDNGTLDDTSDDRVKSINDFPGSKLYAMVQDKDGEIWVGTDEGVAVFYNASNVFNENISAEQILIQQDGITQILLGSEGVTSIAVDGANRKWIGTQNSGVYLLSEDGTEEIEHFTTNNSPLFSNTIYDIVIDEELGEVYFGTERGLISYKGTATEPKEEFNIFVYPNPVRPEYEGVIAIRGLVQDTDVRITDISGNIVFETTSLGGQAIWNGKDYNGNRVKSGVYMVFNGSPDGAKKAAAKILFID